VNVVNWRRYVILIVAVRFFRHTVVIVQIFIKVSFMSLFCFLRFVVQMDVPFSYDTMCTWGPILKSS